VNSLDNLYAGAAPVGLVWLVYFYQAFDGGGRWVPVDVFPSVIN